MVVGSKFRLLSRGALLALALLFLSANITTEKHLVHTGLAKLITFDHQVRRDLWRAERESIKTSALSGRGELIPNLLQEPAGINWSQEIVVNSCPMSQSPTQLQPKRIFLDSSAVLNL